MEIKNLELEVVLNFVASRKCLPTARDSVNVVKFVRKLRSALEEFTKDRTTLLEQYCSKGDDGKPLVKDDQYVFDSDEVKQVALESIEVLHNDVIELSDDLKLSQDIDVSDLSIAELDFFMQFIEGE